ncbi:oxidoreductase [Rufibacter sp. DG15C]|uniref:oxidoreductase n=1 Tax=Rufibacter sp. DG15C TaxID=1379909 RepID=UPI00078D08D7|nr:oxidoreductase [Rufibacter sp. DG15C]AMM50358.1 oxidoreductase [Rufibacter sp. DG15C]
MIRVGLIGYGMAGQVFHAPFVEAVDGLELTRIRESREENIRLANDRYPKAAVTANVQDILQDDDIDLVIVAVPNSAHYSLAKEALLAGKHVVVEKPFTVSSAEAEELIELAKSQGKVLTVYHNRRWDSDFRTIQKLVQQNLLGTLVEYRAHFDRFRNAVRANTWKEEEAPGTGILYDLGSHLIDQALTLFGMPKAIWADIRSQREGSQIPDKFETVLFYDKLKVVLTAGMLVREPGPRYILHGDKGSFFKHGLDVQEEALKQGLFPKALPTTWGVEPEHLWGQLNTDIHGLHFIGKVESETGDYRGFYDNVEQAIIGEAELAVKPEQARDVIRIIELAMQSSEEKRVVEVG